MALSHDIMSLSRSIMTMLRLIILLHADIMALSHDSMSLSRCIMAMSRSNKSLSHLILTMSRSNKSLSHLILTMSPSFLTMSTSIPMLSQFIPKLPRSFPPLSRCIVLMEEDISNLSHFNSAVPQCLFSRLDGYASLLAFIVPSPLPNASRLVASCSGVGTKMSGSVGALTLDTAGHFDLEHASTALSARSRGTLKVRRRYSVHRGAELRVTFPHLNILCCLCILFSLKTPIDHNRTHDEIHPSIASFPAVFTVI